MVMEKVDDQRAYSKVPKVAAQLLGPHSKEFPQYDTYDIYPSILYCVILAVLK